MDRWIRGCTIAHHCNLNQNRLVPLHLGVSSVEGVVWPEISPFSVFRRSYVFHLAPGTQQVRMRFLPNRNVIDLSFQRVFGFCFYLVTYMCNVAISLN